MGNFDTIKRSKLVQSLNRSHIYSSLLETMVKTLMLAFTTGASMLCYFGTFQEPKVIGGATLLYVLSVMSEIFPKANHLANLLNRIYIFAIYFWSLAMLLGCGYLIFKQEGPTIEFNSLFIIITLIPIVIYIIDTFIYFLCGTNFSHNTDDNYDVSSYIPTESKFREMRNI